jgi:hypothetical protein
MNHRNLLRSTFTLLVGGLAVTSVVACGGDDKSTITSSAPVVTDAGGAGDATDDTTAGTGDPNGTGTGDTLPAADVSTLAGRWTGACATDAYLLEGHPFTVIYELAPNGTELNITADLTIYDTADTDCAGTPLGDVNEQAVLAVGGQADIEGVSAVTGQIESGTNCGASDETLCDLALGLFQDEQYFAFGIDATGQLRVSEPAAGDNGHGVPNAWQQNTQIVKG